METHRAGTALWIFVWTESYESSSGQIDRSLVRGTVYKDIYDPLPLILLAIPVEFFLSGLERIQPEIEFISLEYLSNRWLRSV